jgi:hypothetical protein
MSASAISVACLPLATPPLGSDPYPILIFKVGQQWSHNLGAQVTTEMERNDEGIMVPRNLRTDSVTPVLNFTPDIEDANTTAFRYGRLLNTAAGNGVYAWSKVVTADTIPAATAGFQGFGAVADDLETVASVVSNGVVVTLDRVAFAGFTPATPDTFAIGLNGALRFSTNLIGKKVNVLYKYASTTVHSHGTQAGLYKVKASFVRNTRDGIRTNSYLNMDRAQVNLQESGVLNNGDPNQIVITDLSGKCTSDIFDLITQPSC